MSRKKKKRKAGAGVLLLMSAMLGAGGVGVAQYFGFEFSQLEEWATEQVDQQIQTAYAEEQQDAWTKIQPRLQGATGDSDLAAQLALENVRLFFKESRKGVPAFAEEMLSIKSKWLAAKGKMPWSNDQEHRKFVRDQFSDSIFSPADLEKVIETAVLEYVASLEAIENQMLVDVRADLADYPEGAFPELQTEEDFQVSYAAAVDDVSALIETDSAIVTGRIVASEVAAIVAVRVLTAVGTRMGVSAGILSAGAASSTVTLGAGIVLGIAVDQVVGWVIGWFYDAEKNIADKVRGSLKDIEKGILAGTETHPGLEETLRQIGDARARARRLALDTMIRGDGAEAPLVLP
ncbi:MAG: hypothetical protein AAF555_05030 [Verrucomicrobiota bacterium]